MDIYVTLTFDAAHRLPNVPPGHRCGNLHGHTFQVEVLVSGDLDGQMGWVVDFGDVKKLVRPIVDSLDHSYLNEIPGLENPTSENIARWLWERIAPVLSGVARIVVKESPSSGAIYSGA